MSDNTLGRLLHHVRTTPAAPAVRDESGELSYAALVSAARARADTLSGNGARRGSRVAIECGYGTDYVISLLAAWMLDAVAVPLDLMTPADRRRYQVEQARCDVAMTGPYSDGVVDRAVARVRNEAGRSVAGDDREPSAYILFTSGSTGVPKGVEVEHSGLTNLLEHFIDHLPLSPGDTMLAHSNIVFDMSVPEMLLPLTSGGTMVVAPPRTARNPEFFAQWLRANPVDAGWATPTQLRLMVPFLRGDRVFGTLISGGEALPAVLADELRKIAGTLWNAYGPTETTVVGLCTEVSPPFTDPMPIGRPITGLRAHVLNDQLLPVPPGTVGELSLSGVGVARGYVGNPELTARAFITGPDGERMYRTGDLVTVGPDGQHYFRGRRDDQVKIRGHRVELGEIETVARRLRRVAQSVAVVSDVMRGEPELYLAVAAWPGERLPDLAEIRDQLQQALPAYMQPKRVLLFDELPRNTAGKTSRQVVQELVEQRLPKTDHHKKEAGTAGQAVE